MCNSTIALTILNVVFRCIALCSGGLCFGRLHCCLLPTGTDCEIVSDQAALFHVNFESFLLQTRTTRLVFAIIGAIIFSLYIVFDTQMMMGGNHKVNI